MSKTIRCSKCRGQKESNKPCLGCFTMDLLKIKKKEKGNDEDGKTR